MVKAVNLKKKSFMFVEFVLACKGWIVMILSFLAPGKDNEVLFVIFCKVS